LSSHIQNHYPYVVETSYFRFFGTHETHETYGTHGTDGTDEAKETLPGKPCFTLF